MLAYQEAQPSPRLSDVVLRYYDIQGTSSEAQPYELSAFPLVNTSWIFHYGEVMHVSGHNYHAGYRLPHFYNLGQFTKPIFIRHDLGNVGVFGVVFRAGASFYLNGAPQHTFKNVSIEMDGIYGRAARTLSERLFECQDIAEKVEVVEAFIWNQLKRTKAVANFVDAAVERIVKAGGNITAEALARYVGAERAYLGRRFKERTGMGVKEFCRVVRFNHALAYLKQVPQTPIADLAANFGYYDSSHLIKDMKEFTDTGRPALHAPESELALFLSNGT